MPDHVHIVLEGKSHSSDLWKTISQFKQKTGYWLSKNSPTHKWQKSFYDHILRKDEDLKKYLMYIVNNPIRKGLVKNWFDYPYLGSLDHDINNLLI